MCDIKSKRRKQGCIYDRYANFTNLVVRPHHCCSVKKDKAAVEDLDLDICRDLWLGVPIEDSAYRGCERIDIPAVAVICDTRKLCGDQS